MIRGIEKRSRNQGFSTWVVVKMMVFFWIPIIVWHLIFRVPKKGQNFDNHPHDPILT